MAPARTNGDGTLTPKNAPGTFIVLPKSLYTVYGPSIGPAGIAVYGALATFSPHIAPSRDALSQMLGVTSRHVEQTIKTLEGVGLVRVERETGRRNIYHLVSPRTSEPGSPHQRTTFATTSEPGSPKEEQRKKNKKEEQPPPPAADDAIADTGGGGGGEGGVIFALPENLVHSDEQEQAITLLKAANVSHKHATRLAAAHPIGLIRVVLQHAFRQSGLRSQGGFIVSQLDDPAGNGYRRDVSGEWHSPELPSVMVGGVPMSASTVLRYGDFLDGSAESPPVRRKIEVAVIVEPTTSRDREPPDSKAEVTNEPRSAGSAWLQLRGQSKVADATSPAQGKKVKAT